MAIIPASKPNAAWNVSHKLNDLLGWARHPDPNALTEVWAESHKQNIIGATDAAIRSFADDARTIQKLKSVRKLAFEFIALLLDRPKLSTIPPEEWSVQAYRQLFDDLAELQREFRIMGDAVETPNSDNPEAAVPIANPESAACSVKTKRRTKPRMTVHQVQAHWLEVVASGNRDLIQDYLTLAETKLAKRIGCSRNTLRACELFQNRGIALREFNRKNS